MSIILWIVIGGLIGWVATLLLGKDKSYGVLANILFGIAGSFVGGLIFSFVGISPISGFNIMSIVASLVGAVLVVWVFTAMKKSAHA